MNQHNQLSVTALSLAKTFESFAIQFTSLSEHLTNEVNANDLGLGILHVLCKGFKDEDELSVKQKRAIASNVIRYLESEYVIYRRLDPIATLNELRKRVEQGSVDANIENDIGASKN